MPRSTCPDPALLQAYVDGTLFSRDVPVVEQHVASCERCAAIVAATREEREAARASTWSRPRVIGTAFVAIVVGAITTWAVWPRSTDAPPNEVAATPPPAPTPVPAPAPASAPKAVAPPPAKPSAPAVAERPKPVVKLRRLMASYYVGLAGRPVAWCGVRGMSQSSTRPTAA